MAGLPQTLIERSREILANLEANELTPNSNKPRLAARRRGINVDENQLNLFADQGSAKVAKELKKVDVNNLTPMQALKKLDELKQLIKK